MQIRQVLLKATEYLKNHQIDTAKTDAEALLCDLINTNRVNLYLNDKLSLTKDRLNQYQQLLERRAKHEPIAYILGKKKFMDWEFVITKDVLIPRPETEILVEKIINIGKKILNFSLIIADIGTGSGIIAISLALSLNAKVYAIDISACALDVAKLNADKLGVKDKITFLRGDILSPLKKFNLNKKVDFIVSNPPYVASYQFEHLQEDVKFEPKIALDGGKLGLNFYDKIINDSLYYLKEGGYLALEVGFDQAEIINDKIIQTKKFKEINIIKDYAGIKRIIIARR
jgi:release factor glutamine methyltransferase